jgi:hypothetical protein
VICASPVTTTGALGPCCVPPHAAVPPGHAGAVPQALAAVGADTVVVMITVKIVSVATRNLLRDIGHSAQIVRTAAGSLALQTNDALPYHSCPKLATVVNLPATNTLVPATAL